MYITSRLPHWLNLIYVEVKTVSIYLKNFLMQNEYSKSQIHAAMRKSWDVNSSDCFTFNRLLYYLLLRFHLSSFLHLLPRETFFLFFINESLEVNQAVIKHSFLPRGQYNAVLPWEDHQEDPGSGSYIRDQFGHSLRSVLGSVSRDIGILMRPQVVFLCLFP